MDELGLFTVALGLCGPWRVVRTEFDVEGPRLDLYLDFERGARFACPVKDCAQGGCPLHDTTDKTWRHLDFFQHKALLHARLPRVRCPEHGAGAGQRALGALRLGVFAVVRGAGAQLRRSDAEGEGRADNPRARHQDLASGGTSRARRPRPAGLHRVRRVGMDETSAAKGQDYISIVADLDARKVIFATEERSAQTVARFAADLTEHGGDPDKVTDTSSDMSTAFISGISQYLPNATMTFDRYHLPRQTQRGHRCRAPRRGRHPPGTQAHPLAMAQELGEPLRGAVPAIPATWITQIVAGGTILTDVRGEVSGALILLRKTSPDTVTGRVLTRTGSFMWLRARVDNPLRNGGRYTTVFSLDGAESRTTEVAPELVDDRDFRFVLQRYVPRLQAITWARRDDAAVLELRADDRSWVEVVVAEAQPGRYRITQGGPHRIWEDVEQAASVWNSLGRPVRQRFGVTATVDGKHRYWLDSPDGQYLAVPLALACAVPG